MRFRDLQARLATLTHQASVYEELTLYLNQTQFVSPAGNGLVPPAIVALVVAELEAKMEAICLEIVALEESNVEVESHANVIRFDGPR